MNLNLTVTNVIQSKFWITANASLNAKIQKDIMHAKKLIFGILLHVVLYINARYTWSFIDDSMATCDEITEVAKIILTKTFPTKSIPTNYTGKSWSAK